MNLQKGVLKTLRNATNRNSVIYQNLKKCKRNKLSEILFSTISLLQSTFELIYPKPVKF